MKHLLSADELDALLSGFGDGAADRGGDELPAGETSRRLEGGQTQPGPVVDDLGRCLGQRLPALLHKPVQVALDSARPERIGEYLDSLEVPTGLFSFRLEPAGGMLMVVMDAHLGYSLIESLFGGHGRQAAIRPRGFSVTEQLVLNFGLDSILDAMRTAWRGELDGQTFTACESENNPQASSVFDDIETVMVRRYSICFEGGGGELCLVMSDELVTALFGNGAVDRPPAGSGGDAGTSGRYSRGARARG